VTDALAPFGTAPDGSPVQIAQIVAGAVTARVMSWGASLVDFRLGGVPLVLGCDAFDAYLGPMRYFGAIVGPVANRIAGGRMVLGGQRHDLDRNEAGCTTLHGGSGGFGTSNWRIAGLTGSSVTLALHRPDALGGFPGPLEVEARYTLDDGGALTLDITATTDRETVFAPAFHGYWSLDGQPDLGGHRLTVAAETYLPVDAAKIPEGAPQPVAGTVFDHRTPRAPAPRLDHNFCLSTERGPLRHACTLEAGGLRLEVSSTEPGQQVYAGAKIDTAPFRGHGGAPHGPNAGIAIEPQGWPDAVNRPDFPPVVLRRGEPYRQTSRFAVTRID